MSSFDASVFLSSTFDPVSLVSQAPDLTELGRSLESHLNSLQRDLYDLINRDYADFILVNSKLTIVERRVGDLSRPVRELLSGLQAVEQKLDRCCTSLDEKLRKKEQLKERQQDAQNCLRLLKVLEKAESLLGIGQDGGEQRLPAAAPGGSKQAGEEIMVQQFSYALDVSDCCNQAGDRSVRDECAQLERASHYAVVLREDTAVCVSEGSKAPENGDDQHNTLLLRMAPRARQVEAEVTQRLKSVFSQLIEGPRSSFDPIALASCLRAFDLLKCGKEAEGQFSQVMLQPFIDHHFTPGQLDGGGGRGSCEGLAEILRLLLEHLRANSEALVLAEEMFFSTDGTEGSIDFICNSVWRVIQRGLVTRLGSIFSSGIASLIHRNYTTSMQFVDGLAGLCGQRNRSRVSQRLARHEAMAEFRGLWNLPVYAQLRAAEISGGIDAVLADPSSATCQVASVFDMPEVDQVWVALQTCWKADVFLQPLADRFLRLSLQILNCLRVWASSGGGGTNRSPEQLVQVAWNVHLLVGKLKGEFTSLTWKTLEENGLPQRAGDLVESALGEAIESCESIAPELWKAIVSHIAGQCATILQAVKGITATYRMTNKRAPDRASPFVKNITRPLREFEREWGSRAPPSVRDTWVQEVALLVTQKYSELLRNLLDTVHQMEQALQKRKTKVKKSSDGATDTEKIVMQLNLDAQDFGTELADLGVALPECTAFQDIKSLIAAECENKR